MNQLFDYADTRDDFKLFFSFDFYQTGDINAHAALYTQFANRPSYLRYGNGNLPVVSSYSGGGIGVDAWRNFKTANNVYIVPNPEADGNYYSQPATFFQNWGNVVDGVFSWETSWPDVSDTPGANVSSARDESVKIAADAGKSYIMGMWVLGPSLTQPRTFGVNLSISGLSTLQYKHCCGDSWYRAGETNLPERMNQILQLSPEFTEVITWVSPGANLLVHRCYMASRNISRLT